MAWQDRPYYREQGGFGGGLRLGFTPPSPMALYVIVACIGVFVLQALTAAGGPLADSLVARWGRLEPDLYRGLLQPWRWVTYQYLHGDAMHIFWNILGIYWFVPPVERVWGPRKTFAFYTAGGLAAAALYGVVSLFTGPAPLVGASGSIFAALGACALLFPEQQILLFFIIPITLRALAIIMALLWTLLIIGHRDLSSAAHLGGLAFGFFSPLYAGPVWRSTQQRWKRRQAARAARSERDEQAEIDRILQKVHDSGMNSLSWMEKRTLKAATERQRQADLARARRAR